MQRLGRRDAGIVRLFFVLVFLPMLCVFPYIRDINNPNEFGRVFTTMMLVEKGTYVIDEPFAIWGGTGDIAHVPTVSDPKTPHFTAVKAPGATYWGVPTYALFSKVIAPILGKKFPTPASSAEEKNWWLRASTWAMRLGATQLPCFLFLIWLERYLRAFTNDTVLRLLGVAACGLGTNYLAYTHIFASHSQYAAFAFLAFGLLERERRLFRHDAKKRRWKMALAAGFFTSACVLFEYHAFIVVLVLCLFALRVFWRPTRLVAFGLGAVVNAPLVMIYHWRCYGSPFRPGHQVMEGYAQQHSTGLWGVVWPTWEHVQALSIDPGFGFFGMSPFMWLGLVGVLFVLFYPTGTRTRRSDVRIAALVAAIAGGILICVNAGIVNWRAGWTVGPRYLVAGAPFFAFLSVLALERFSAHSAWRRAVARGIGGGLALASILTIGTVGFIHDTLPETIRRPFLQFAVPMAWVGFVPHHVGEWFGWESTTLSYVALGALVLCGIVPALFFRPESPRLMAIRAGVFVVALAAGMVPQFTAPEDGTKLWVVYSAAAFGPIWEPPGRDRIALLRVEAERYGTRGRGPCMWLKLAELENIAGMPREAMRDRARANGVTRDQCHLRQVYPLPKELRDP